MKKLMALILIACFLCISVQVNARGGGLAEGLLIGGLAGCMAANTLRPQPAPVVIVQQPPIPNTPPPDPQLAVPQGYVPYAGYPGYYYDPYSLYPMFWYGGYYYGYWGGGWHGRYGYGAWGHPYHMPGAMGGFHRGWAPRGGGHGGHGGGRR